MATKPKKDIRSILADINGSINDYEEKKAIAKAHFLKMELDEVLQEKKDLEESVNVVTQENIKIIKEKIIFQLLSGKHVIDIQTMYRYYEDIVWKYENERDEYPGQSIETFIMLIGTEVFDETPGSVDDFFDDYDVKIIVTPKNQNDS